MGEQGKLDAEATIDRRSRKERRTGDQQKKTAAVAPEHPNGSERRKVERRRHIDPTTCERDYTDAEIEFMKAMDKYKRSSGRSFPTWSEVLEVLRDLGYRRE